MVTTDTNGQYSLEINLSPASYTGCASFLGDNQYTASNSNIANITVTKINKTGTALIVNNFKESYGAGLNFTGILAATGTVYPISGQTIAVKLTRLNNGASKTYYLTTDSNGQFQLPINLGIGKYSALCSYTGTNQYNPSSASATLTVTS